MSKQIRVSEATKHQLDQLKVHPREPYEDVLKRLLAKKEVTARA